ncbi:MAG: hypothetical protein LUG86_08900 [Oscillospiraceae bacterium]|nr:hypothetical protein [Oscillospiraceae bacterium]
MRTELEILAERCGAGDADAMLELSELLRKSATSAKHDIYRLGANMWLLRAAIYGNKQAQERVMEIFSEGRWQGVDFLEDMTFPYENFIPGKRDNWRTGKYSGRDLNEIGLFAFEPGELYNIAGLSKGRYIEIGRYLGFDGPDEDGFGYEEYYRYSYLDQYFQIPDPEKSKSDRQGPELWFGFLEVKSEERAIK